MTRNELTAGRYYLVRFGSKGAQICEYLGLPPRADGVLLRKYSRRARKWTKPAVYSADLVLCPITAEEERAIRQRSAWAV